MSRFFHILVGSLCLISCGTNVKSVGEYRLEDRYDFIGILRTGDNPDAFIQYPRFVYYDEGSVILWGTEKVTRVNIVDGSTAAIYGHSGRGPDEYSMVFNCFVKNGDVYVQDMAGKVLVFNSEGKYKESIQIGDGSVTMNKLDIVDNDHFVIGYSSISGKEQLFDVLDTDLNLARESSLRPDNLSTAKKGGTRIAHFMRFNGSLCVSMPSCDTLYRITPEEDIPYFVTDAKTLGLGGGMTVSDIMISGKDVFISAKSENAMFRSVVDIDSGESMLNVRIYGPEDPHGVPFRINGVDFQVWPEFTGGGLLIAPTGDGESFLCFRQKKFE